MGRHSSGGDLLQVQDFSPVFRIAAARGWCNLLPAMATSNPLNRALRGLYTASLKENFERAARIFSGHTAGTPASTVPARNKVLDGLLEENLLPELVALALRRSGGGTFLVAGETAALSRLPALAAPHGCSVTLKAATAANLANLALPADGRVVLALTPATEAEWTAVYQLRQKLGARLVLLLELLLPYTQLLHLFAVGDYFAKTPGDVLALWLGQRTDIAVEKLNEVVPLRGLDVIEFGPLDGAQTASLLHAGVRKLTCIETRPENVLKVNAARDAFGWPALTVAMDDFHNVDASRYGPFDVCFAHGVYYHSIAPFVFLHNLRSLAKTIFVGGFCATDALPVGDYVELEHEGRRYRAKAYREAKDATAGVNQTGYYFHRDDLIRFFTERGDEVQIVSTQPMTVHSGEYARILVRRKG